MREARLARDERRDGLAGAAQDPLVGREALEPDRPARVELAGRDADLGAEAEAEAVGEARGAVPEDVGRVDGGEEALGGGAVLRDDGVGVVRAVGGFIEGTIARAAASPRSSTPFSAIAEARAGRKAGAAASWTRSVSIELQVEGACVLASTAMRTAIATSAEAST